MRPAGWIFCLGLAFCIYAGAMLLLVVAFVGLKSADELAVTIRGIALLSGVGLVGVGLMGISLIGVIAERALPSPRPTPQDVDVKG